MAAAKSTKKPTTTTTKAKSKVKSAKATTKKTTTKAKTKTKKTTSPATKAKPKTKSKTTTTAKKSSKTKKSKTSSKKSSTTSFFTDVIKQATKAQKTAQTQTKALIKQLNALDKQQSQLITKQSTAKGKTWQSLDTKVVKLKTEITSVRTALLASQNTADKIATFIDWTTNLNAKPSTGAAIYSPAQTPSKPSLVKSSPYSSTKAAVPPKREVKPYQDDFEDELDEEEDNLDKFPKSTDPKLWLVKCRPGKEKECVLKNKPVFWSVFIFGAFLCLKLFGLENNIYAQIAMIMLIGLLGKNAVLIVEFAAKKHSEGETTFNSAIEGAKVRFRPILMTSFAFIAGLIPLMFASGPGKLGNRTIGTAAAGGMLIGTIFGVFLIPGLYFIFGSIASRHQIIQDEEENPLTEEIEPHE